MPTITLTDAQVDALHYLIEAECLCGDAEHQDDLMAVQGRLNKLIDRR